MFQQIILILVYRIFKSYDTSKYIFINRKVLLYCGFILKGNAKTGGYNKNEAPQLVIKDASFISWFVLVLLLIGYMMSEFVRVPVYYCGSIAFIFLILAAKSNAVPVRKVVKGAPWNIVIFSLGM